MAAAVQQAPMSARLDQPVTLSVDGATLSIPTRLVADEPRVERPNPVVDNNVFAKLGKTAIIEANPAMMHFAGYQVGQTHTQTLRVVNMSGSSRRLVILPPSTPFFRINVNKKGHLAPGMGEDIEVEFTPDEWRYYYDSVRVHAEDENILVPIHAYPVMNENVFPRFVDLGDCPISETTTRVIPLTCKVPVHFEFEITITRPHPDFRVSPLRGVVPGNGHVEVCIDYRPSVLATVSMEMSINVAQFGFEPVLCTVTGSSSPGITRTHLLTQTMQARQRRSEEAGAATGTASLKELAAGGDPRELAATLVRSGKRVAGAAPGTLDDYGAAVSLKPRGGGGGAAGDPLSSLPAGLLFPDSVPPAGAPPLEAAMEQPERDVDGVFVPAEPLKGHATVAYVLNQQKGKMSIKQLKLALAQQREQQQQQRGTDASRGRRGSRAAHAQEGDPAAAAALAALLHADSGGDPGPLDAASAATPATPGRPPAAAARSARSPSRGAPAPPRPAPPAPPRRRGAADARRRSAYRAAVELEKSKDLRWFVCVGDAPLSEEHREAVLEGRRKTAEREAREALAASLARVSTRVPGGAGGRVERPAGDRARWHVPTWDGPKLNDTNRKRAAVLGRFRQAAYRVILSRRLHRVLRRIRAFLEAAGHRLRAPLSSPLAHDPSASPSPSSSSPAAALAPSASGRATPAARHGPRPLLRLVPLDGPGADPFSEDTAHFLSALASGASTGSGLPFSIPPGAMYHDPFGPPPRDSGDAEKRAPVEIKPALERPAVDKAPVKVPLQYKLLSHKAQQTPALPVFPATEAARQLRVGALDEAGILAPRGAATGPPPISAPEEFFKAPILDTLSDLLDPPVFALQPLRPYSEVDPCHLLRAAAPLPALSRPVDEPIGVAAWEARRELPTLSEVYLPRRERPAFGVPADAFREPLAGPHPSDEAVRLQLAAPSAAEIPRLFFVPRPELEAGAEAAPELEALRGGAQEAAAGERLFRVKFKMPAAKAAAGIAADAAAARAAASAAARQRLEEANALFSSVANKIVVDE
eukprot:tig00021623_g23007.t1